jgi:succinate-acetate transporter protein
MTYTDGHAPTSVDEVTRVILRPIANPLPLGFLALGAGSLVLAGYQLGWVAISEGSATALILLAFVFPLQLLASVLGYLARDVVAGTGMGILSVTWLATSLVMLTSPPGSTSGSLGLLLLFAAVALLVPSSVATMGKVLPGLVLFVAACRFATSGVYQLLGTSGNDWKTASGVVGLVLCALAVYTAFAMAWEDALRRTVLPVLRRGRGRESVSGNFADQLRLLEREAGVREQL